MLINEKTRVADRLFVTAEWPVNTEQASVLLSAGGLCGHVRGSRTVFKTVGERWKAEKSTVKQKLVLNLPFCFIFVLKEAIGEDWKEKKVGHGGEGWRMWDSRCCRVQVVVPKGALGWGDGHR